MVNIFLTSFRWFWTFNWIITFIPFNFWIALCFTNVTWTSRRISFIDNTIYNRFYLLKEMKIVHFLVFHFTATLNPSFVNFKIFQKNVLISLSSQECISMDIKGLVISSKASLLSEGFLRVWPRSFYKVKNFFIYYSVIIKISIHLHVKNIAISLLYKYCYIKKLLYHCLFCKNHNSKALFKHFCWPPFFMKDWVLWQ